MIASRQPATLFQSTLSVRRATVGVVNAHLRFLISIHALRKESDAQEASGGYTVFKFQSTLSVRRATGRAAAARAGQ